MRYIGISLLLFMFISCTRDSGVYEKIYDKNFKGISSKSVSLNGDNYYLLDKVERSFKKEGIKIKKGAVYKVVMSSHYVISCANPVVHAVGADYSGYIRLSVYKKDKELYRIQKDFRSKVTQDMIDRIVKKMVSDRR